MKILFYKKNTRKNPVLNFLDKLNAEDRLRILACLKNVEELGFDSPRVQLRQIRGKLWEIKIKVISGGYRFFYVTIKLEWIVILHVYKKQSQKTPLKEIQLAEMRMKEVLNDETLYFA